MAKRRKIDKPVTVESIAAAVRGEAPETVRPPPARHFTSGEFVEWVEANCFNLSKNNVWEPFAFTDWQRRECETLISLDDAGKLKALTWMLCWPRRHGKSQVGGFYDIKRCMDYADQNVIICANSADQSEGTVFKMITDTLTNSPKLKALVDAQRIIVGTTEVYFAETGSRIVCIPHSEASAYGKKIHVAHNTELCKARTDAVYQVLASSTGDTWCGLVICDSNVGDEANAVVHLLGLSGVHFEQGAIVRGQPEDPSIVSSFVGYESLDQAIELGPTWIARPWLESRRNQMTAGEFKRNHLNIPSSGSEVCFPLIHVKRAAVDWLKRIIGPNELSEIRGRYQHRVLHIGGGLDRSTGLAVKSDRTIWTEVGAGFRQSLVGQSMDVFDDAGNTIGSVPADPWEYCVLRQTEIPFSLEKNLKDAIDGGRRLFGRYTRIMLETYQARDIYEWCTNKGLPAELVAMTWQAKAGLVRMALEMLATERLKFAASNWLLYHELLNYREDMSSATPSYGGPKRTIRVTIEGQLRDVVIKDDALESALWALHAVVTSRKSSASGWSGKKPIGW